MNRLKIRMRKNSFLSQLMSAFFLIICLVSLVMAAFSLGTIIDNNRKRLDEYQTDLIKQVGTKLEFYSKDIQIAQLQTISVLIQQDVFNQNNDAVVITVQIENSLQNIRRTSQCVHEISVFSFDGSFFTSSGAISSDLRNRDWMQKFITSDQSNAILQMRESEYKTRRGISDQPALLFLKKVYHPQNARDVLGVVLVSARYDVLQRAISNESVLSSKMLLLDSHDMVFCSQDEQEFGISADQVRINEYALSDLIDEKIHAPYMVKTYGIDNLDWELVNVISQTYMLDEITSFMGLVVIVIFSIVMASIWGYVLSRRITKPISEMVMAMNEVGKGNFEISLPEFNNEDFNSLANGFNSMVDHIGQLIRKLLSQEIETANARFLALQAQINPHFFYNTLETIRGIAMKNQVESIADITKSMSQIFRYSINHNDGEVTLWEEFQYVYNYVSIQKYRYKERLTVDFDLDEEVLQYKTIKLVIQPLVENAICHGLEPQKNPVIIRVVCKKDNERILVRVSDNGAGISDEKMQEITKRLKEEKNIPGKSIGLYNVHHRLKLFYGNEYGLQLQNNTANGTEVTLYLPLKKENGGH